MSIHITESMLEITTLEWFVNLGYETQYGPDITDSGSNQERASHSEVLLINRLQSSLERLNPNIPADSFEDIIRKVTITQSPNLIENNHEFHKYLIEDVPVEYRDNEGRIVNDYAKVVDFDDPENNDWLVVNQFTVKEDRNTRRPDIVVFVNGLPLAVIELKNPRDEDATIHSAFNQLQTYKNEIPSLFTYNQALIAADGIKSRMGTLTADWEWFQPWRTSDGINIAPSGSLELKVLIQGVFDKHVFLDLIRYYIVFADDGKKTTKIMASYHQYHASNKAIHRTVTAISPEGDKRIGVVWHTQGSGKSLTMSFFAGKLIQDPVMENPTLVVITDRNDLDQQLFDKFAACHELLRQKPVQAQSRDDLRKLLHRESGGVIFTTIQKFFPEEKSEFSDAVSTRRNIIVIADEAHRSQYDFIDGFARHMRDTLPGASFIGFTGTPIELSDKNTPAVFGDYIDIYDIEQAVVDEATVRIYYEGRLAKINLRDEMKPKIDPEFEEATESEEIEGREKLKTKWARLEALVGAKERVEEIAKDIIKHFEHKIETLEGKGIIVCMSRRICVDLHNELIKLRPHWFNKDDAKGFLKVIMTGGPSDPQDWQQHIRDKNRREKLAIRFKDPKEPFSLAIVRDMWLTGFDAPCLHTMYVDKPMRGHGLMQAIARVNRVFKNKPGGFVVDYIGLAEQLKYAMADYTQSGGRGSTTIDQDVAVAEMLKRYEIIRDMFHGFEYGAFFSGSNEEKITVLAQAADFILGLEDGQKRFKEAVAYLNKAFALSVPHDEAMAIRDIVGFFQAVNAVISKSDPDRQQTMEDMETAIKQLISRAVASDKVIDIFSAAGLKKPDISILSDEFLEEVRHIEYKNLSIEMLRRLINDELKLRRKKNLVESRKFSEMLENAIRRYQNRTIETAEVIAELINLAKDLREAHKRGEEMNLQEDELAFYDALAENESAVIELGDEILKKIAVELAEKIRNNYSIDWTLKESARADMRRIVKRLLRKYNYPPDKQEKATQTVIHQAELMSKEMAA